MQFFLNLPKFFRYSISIILLLITAIILILFFNKENSKANNSTKIDLQNYDEFKIRQGTKELFFHKVTGNIWIIKGAEPQRVDLESLNDLKETLSNFKLKEIISENPNKYGYYNVTDETALVICFFKHGNIAEKYYIGKTNTTYNTTFIRKENDRAVYQENGQLTTRFRPEKTEWTQEGLPQITTDNINIVVVKFPTRNFTYTLDKNKNWLSWTGSTGNQIPTDLLNKFSTLEISSPLSPSRATEIIPTRETYTIEFRDDENNKNTYRIYLLDNLGVYLKSDPFVYKVKSNLYTISSANYYIKKG